MCRAIKDMEETKRLCDICVIFYVYIVCYEMYLVFFTCTRKADLIRNQWSFTTTVYNYKRKK